MLKSNPKQFRYINKFVDLSLISLLLLIRSSICQAPINCPSATSKDAEEIKIPYSISYGFKTIDRNYGSPTGLSKQTGTLTFKMSFFNSQLDVILGNRNFVVGKDSTGERATNFGNSSIELTYSPTKLQESSRWADSKFFPSVFFDYTATLPTGRRSKGLNVGRVDHDVVIGLSKLLGKKIAIQKEDEFGSPTGIYKDTFARKTSVETDFGISFSGKELGGFKKTGNFIFSITRVLSNAQKKKYSYKGEVDLFNLAKHEKASAVAVNTLFIKLNPKSRFGIGVITGLKNGTSRFGLNFSIKYSGSFKISKN